MTRSLITQYLRLPYVMLVAAVFAVYANVYDNAFLFDDNLLIELNRYLRSWATFGKLFTASTTEGAQIGGGFYRPVQNILYFFVFQLGGGEPFGFHLLNVAAHAVCATLGYRLAIKLGFDARAALFGTLLWVVHPLHTEAITYMSGTADPLFVMFGLGALNMLLPVPTPKRMAGATGLFLLALLSKETAVVFPALAVMILFVLSDRNNRLKWRIYTPTLPLWALALVFLAWRVTTTDFDGPARYEQLFKMQEFASIAYYAHNLDIRITTFFATLPAYAELLVWPVGLYMERNFPFHTSFTNTPVLIGMAMVVAASGHIIYALRNQTHKAAQALAFGLLWFGISHAPNAGIVFPMNSIFLEHWMYLPTLGLFLGLSQAAIVCAERVKWHEARVGLAAMVFCGLMVLSARTVDQNRVWQDPITFYKHIFSFGVESPRCRNNLATAYIDRGMIKEAIEQYRIGIAQGDTYAETHYNLALALVKLPNQQQHLPEAIAELHKSLEIEPGFFRSYQALAQIYDFTGEKEKAAYNRNKAEEILKRR